MIFPAKNKTYRKQKFLRNGERWELKWLVYVLFTPPAKHDICTDDYMIKQYRWNSIAGSKL